MTYINPTHVTSQWFLLTSKSFQVTSLQLPFLHYFVKCSVVQHFL